MSAFVEQDLAKPTTEEVRIERHNGQIARAEGNVALNDATPNTPFIASNAMAAAAIREEEQKKNRQRDSLRRSSAKLLADLRDHLTTQIALTEQRLAAVQQDISDTQEDIDVSEQILQMINDGIFDLNNPEHRQMIIDAGLDPNNFDNVIDLAAALDDHISELRDDLASLKEQEVSLSQLLDDLNAALVDVSIAMGSDNPDQALAQFIANNPDISEQLGLNNSSNPVDAIDQISEAYAETQDQSNKILEQQQDIYNQAPILQM